MIDSPIETAASAFTLSSREDAEHLQEERGLKKPMSASICGRLAAGAFFPILAMAASSAFALPPITSFRADWSADYTAWGHVTALETGPYDDTMSITLDPSVPFVNSSRGGGLRQESCTVTDAGYALDPKDPGVKAHEATLLAAFIAGKKVRLLVNACWNDKPRAIAVGIE